MKRQIRYGIFESNSSSSHCLLITKNDKVLAKEDFHHENESWDENKEYLYIHKGKLTSVWDNDLYFGRSPFELLTSVEDKTRYALASFCGDYSGHTDEQKVNYYNEILEALNSVLPELEEIELPTKIIRIYTDLEGKELPEEEVYTNYEVSKESAMRHFYKRDGKKHPAKLSDQYYETPNIQGVDHQSSGLLKSFLEKHNISIKDFLLNKKYIVVIDGDEYNAWSEFKRSGLVDLNNIVEEYEWEEDYASFMEYSNVDEEEEDA